MSNPFDNKIKESLENFEMPYDANAWAQMAEQLPPAGGAAAGTSQLGWKAVALVAVIATTVATAWYLTNDTEVVSEDAVAIEQAQHEKIQQQIDEIQFESEKSDVAAEVESTENIEADETVAVSEKTSSPTDEMVATRENPESSEPKKLTEKPIPVNPSNASERKTENPVAEEKQLVAKFLPSSVTVCVGEDLSFINESSDKSASMTWEFGDGTTATETDPVHNYVQPGTYTINLLASLEAKTASHSVTVTVNPTPNPIFAAERKLNGYVAIPLYRFTTATQPSETAIWSFSDGTRISGNSAEHLFRDAGTSVAKLTITNTFGCSSTMDEKYQTEKFNLIAPNAFSPNGDGHNETFIPAAIPEMGIAFEMSITNPRTGEVVFRTANASEPWNGKMNNVDPNLESGVYIWTVILKDNVVNNKVFNGKINLTR